MIRSLSPATCLALLLSTAVFSLSAQEEPIRRAESTLVPGVVGGTGATADTTVKQSKQVRVICDNPRVQSELINFTDALQGEFRQILHERDDVWRSPLDVKVSGNPQDIVTGATAVIPNETQIHPDGSFQLEMYVRLHRDYDQDEVGRCFIELMLNEIMVRPFVGNPDGIDGKRLKVPYWLVRGIEKLLQYRASGRPSDVFAGIVNSRDLLSVSEILQQKPSNAIDPVTDAVIGASSAALVAALLDQENGPAYLKSYLVALPDNTGASLPASELRRHFPRFRDSPGALEKWWSLQLASMGQRQALEFFSAGETEALLDEALAILVPADAVKEQGPIRKILPQAKPRGPFAGRVHDFRDFLDFENALPTLEQNRIRLRNLSLRAFPLYQGIILRYEIVVSNLVDERTRGVDKELEKLDREREAIRLTMNQVADYMNFFEATQAEGSSEAYEKYREMKEQLRRKGKPERNDRITRYLDALEREFEIP